MAVRALNPSHHTARDQWPVTSPWPVSCVEMNFHIETESSETSKVFIRRKRVQYMWIDTQVGSERESLPRGSLYHFYGAFLLGFLRPIILLCLVLSLYLVYLRVLPCVRAHLLAKLDSGEEAYR